MKNTIESNSKPVSHHPIEVLPSIIPNFISIEEGVELPENIKSVMEDAIEAAKQAHGTNPFILALLMNTIEKNGQQYCGLANRNCIGISLERAITVSGQKNLEGIHQVGDVIEHIWAWTFEEAYHFCQITAGEVNYEEYIMPTDTDSDNFQAEYQAYMNQPTEREADLAVLKAIQEKFGTDTMYSYKQVFHLPDKSATKDGNNSQLHSFLSPKTTPPLLIFFNLKTTPPAPFVQKNPLEVF